MNKQQSKDVDVKIEGDLRDKIEKVLNDVAVCGVWEILDVNRCHGTGKVQRDATVQDVCDALLTYDKECSNPIWKLKSGETLRLRSSYED